MPVLCHILTTSQIHHCSAVFHHACILLQQYWRQLAGFVVIITRVLSTRTWVHDLNIDILYAAWQEEVGGDVIWTCSDNLIFKMHLPETLAK